MLDAIACIVMQDIFIKTTIISTLSQSNETDYNILPYNILGDIPQMTE